MSGDATCADSIVIEDLIAQEQFQEVVRVQETIWGFSEIDLLPVRFFVVASKIGGQVFGAYDAGRMIAFCLAIPGLKPDGKAYLHSHMLGVLPEYRNSGVGRRFETAPKDNALARGIDLIEWTFDPLEIKNAYFQYRAFGRDRAPVCAAISTGLREQSVYRGPADGSLYRRVVDSGFEATGGGGGRRSFARRYCGDSQ